MLERAIEFGVNFLDTADVYGGGESEEILAPWLARNRDELLVATKLGWRARPIDRCHGPM